MIKGDSRFMDCTSGDTSRMGYGGAIAAVTATTGQTGSLHISGQVQFLGTEAAGGPCGIYASQIEAVTVEGAQFSQLTSAEGVLGAYGSALRVEDCGLAEIKNATFDGCKGGSDGGAVMMRSEGVVLEGCTFTNCSARNGGGIYFADYRAKVINTTFTNCAAQNDGGAIYVGGKSQITMEGVTIDSCTAPTGAASSSARQVFQKQTARRRIHF